LFGRQSVYTHIPWATASFLIPFLAFFYATVGLTIPERIDWLWFLEYDIDDDIPNHSVLSKARARWGVEAFKTFFERIVWQCVQAGLVDGSKIFMDSSLVQADASNNSVVNKESLKRYLNKSYQILESRLEQQQRCSGAMSRPNPEGLIKSIYLPPIRMLL
jgi:hypothetical protein